MSQRQQPDGPVARTFTRARVVSTVLARIPLGDKAFDLPAVLNRAQLLALAIGAFASVLAWAAGGAAGVGAALVWPVAVVTAVVVIALKFAAVPDRGASLFVGGYARMLVALAPFGSTSQSSVPRDSGRGRPEAASVRMRFAPPPRGR
jgi:hypothetical protein